MLDIEIKNCYTAIKDPSWPNIQTYLEFSKLPAHIKKECNEEHKFQERKNQITDNNYWINLSSDVCVYKDLAYVPVPKCAYTYHSTLFTNLGWKKIPLKDVDIASTKFFGLIMHPLSRWLKGITQWIVKSYAISDIPVLDDNQWVVEPFEVDWQQLKLDLQTNPFKRLISTVNVGDIHSMPYSVMFGDLLYKINWIPMDTLSDNEVKISLMKFFNLHKHNILLPLNDKRLHESTSNQLDIFNIIKTQYPHNKEQIYSFYKLYSTDLKFYYNLLDTFNPNWQHI
jgi:hypothetical protein